MRTHVLLARSGLAFLAAACGTAPIPTRSVDIRCGNAATQSADTASLDIVLDSAANETIHQIDFELSSGTNARMQLDSVAVSCFASGRGLTVRLAGSWRRPPYLQAGAGTDFARARVLHGQIVLVDTILDMTGPVYRSLSWTKHR
jgi:hypothetical protein